MAFGGTLLVGFEEVVHNVGSYLELLRKKVFTLRSGASLRLRSGRASDAERAFRLAFASEDAHSAGK
jgi:hypothetical protein